MKYVARLNTNIDRLSEEQLLHKLLEVRGVNDPTTFLNLQEDVIHDPNLLKNMDFGLEMFNFHLNQESPHIHIFIDTDADGLTSASFVYLWIQRNFPNAILTFDCNEGKRHGLNEDIISRIPKDTNLMIAPDSSSSDLEWHKVLDKMGIDLLILDHHEIDVDISDTPACVINNQDGQYPNPTLSAPGVVYKFLDEFEYRYFEELGLKPNAHEYMDLVATGMVADLVDMRDFESRFLVLEGLKEFGKDNLLIQAILDDVSSRKDVSNPTIDTIGWDVAPIINAIFRQGDLQDRYDLFKALTNHVETRVYQPLKKTKDNPDKTPIEESLQANIIRRAKSLKGAQDRSVKKELKEIKDEIEQLGLNNNPVIIFNATDKIADGHSGLVANRLAQEYMRPVLMLNGEGGSGRNYDKFPIEDLNDWLSQSGLIECNGHQGAFGLSFDTSNIPLLQQWCNEQLKDQDLSPVYHVDMEIDITKLKNRHIERVGKVMSMFGGKGMEKPSFVVKNIVIETADVQRLGKTQTMLKFTTNINGEEITFVRPFTSTDVYKDFVCESAKQTRGIGTDGVGNKKIEATVIGTFEVNEFNGKSYPQVSIKEFVTKPVDTNGARRRRRF